jgi:hypothetical protein
MKTNSELENIALVRVETKRNSTFRVTAVERRCVYAIEHRFYK